MKTKILFFIAIMLFTAGAGAAYANPEGTTLTDSSGKVIKFRVVHTKISNGTDQKIKFQLKKIGGQWKDVEVDTDETLEISGYNGFKIKTRVEKGIEEKKYKIEPTGKYKVIYSNECTCYDLVAMKE